MTAVAVFVGHGFEFTPGGMREVGMYHLDFTVRGQWAEMASRTRPVIQESKQNELPNSLSTRGEVEEYVRRQIQSWIHLGL
jgi:hypothetical protein